MKRIPQPPIHRDLRARENHDFWPGLIAALVGIVLMTCGARHLTVVDTVAGGAAWETQLVKAFSFGGLQYPGQVPATLPPKPTDDPVASAAALERWARQQANAAPPTWKVRVDTTAKTPCPT